MSAVKTFIRSLIWGFGSALGRALEKRIF